MRERWTGGQSQLHTRAATSRGDMFVNNTSEDSHLSDCTSQAICWELYLGANTRILNLTVYDSTHGQHDVGSVASAYVVARPSPAGEMESPVSENGAHRKQGESMSSIFTNSSYQEGRKKVT